ncbi:MAG: SRPBCC family protein, partial [Thermoleophilaceae bacterium]|nr:SRPBCC family protein [Thermoleophilaceae bacterium]
MKVERSLQFAAPPERVREVVMDPRQLEDWVSIHQSLEDAPSGNLQKGSELTQCLKLA